MNTPRRTEATYNFPITRETESVATPFVIVSGRRILGNGQIKTRPIHFAIIDMTVYEAGNVHRIVEGGVDASGANAGY